MQGHKPTDIKDITTLATRNGYARLAAAVLLQAAKQARDGNQRAAHWLMSEQAAFLAECIGISSAHVRRWTLPKIKERQFASK